ncbi:hypothetical protein [Roseibium sp. RKSG952]|uniref:hypothetical protein n=1 Tax=Roseibium sp. RKSG952 TaxID=2529384 RepID=UPI0012BC94C8|nr:hypothetical protein [Roseibium sp. RKSG952]MTI00033.1 hypothetical protein [Roseibium sp. RKSG952]
MLAIAILVAFPGLISGIVNVNSVAKIALYSFLAFQASGFILFSLRNKRYLNVLNTLMVVGVLGGYVYQSGETQLLFAPHEPIQPLGHNEPPIVIAAYCFWFVGVASNSLRCPKLVEMYVQAASVIFAVFSGSFLFYRILTAWSLFVLDLIFNYTGLKFWGDKALRMSNKFAETKWPKVRAGCECFSFVTLATLVGYLVTGQAPLTEDMMLTAELAFLAQ